MDSAVYVRIGKLFEARRTGGEGWSTIRRVAGAAGEKVKQINDVSAITYSKIRRDDKKERKRKKVTNNGAGRVKKTKRIKGQEWIRT